MAKPSSKTPKGEQSRQHLIETANKLFYAQGYRHTSYSDIVDASGMERGNISYYFKSKDELLLAVIDQRMISIKATLQDWENTLPEPRERLKRFAQMIVNSQHEITAYGCPMGSLTTELGKDETELHKHSRQMFDLLRDWLTAQLQALGYRRQKAALQALHLLARGQGISVIAHVYRDPQLLKREVAGLKQWIDELNP